MAPREGEPVTRRSDVTAPRGRSEAIRRRFAPHTDDFNCIGCLKREFESQAAGCRLTAL
jgi:hypothetical protein